MVRLDLTNKQIAALEAGKNINIKPSQIGTGAVEVDMDEEQLCRVQKCARSKTGRGVRVGGGRPPATTGKNFGGSLKEEYMAYKAKQGGKLKLPNAKQLKKAAAAAKMVGDAGAQMYGYDSLVDAGVSNAQAAAAERGYDNKLTKGAARLAKKQGDRQLDKQLGGKVNWRKVGKVAAKVGKTANHISKAATGDSLSDMAISMALENTLGRVDPTGGLATDMIANQAQKAANKEIDKQGGSFVKQGMGVAAIGVAHTGKAGPIVRSKYKDEVTNANRWVSVRRMQL
jgi:hypothetical protein